MAAYLQAYPRLKWQHFTEYGCEATESSLPWFMDVKQQRALCHGLWM